MADVAHVACSAGIRVVDVLSEASAPKKQECCAADPGFARGDLVAVYHGQPYTESVQLLTECDCIA